jgi:hypothetical protein
MRNDIFRISPRSQYQNKRRYRNVPPGKKLIFRWSRTDPRTGQTIYARGRPFPILVDDVPQHLPMVPLRLVSQPVRVQQARPMARVQKPQQPQRPVYSGAGAVVGGVRAISHLSSSGTPGANFAEVLGGALGGTGSAYVTAFLKSVPANSRPQLPGDATHVVIPNSEELVAQLRVKADIYRQRAAAVGQDGSSFEAFINELLALLMHVGAGAVNGVPVGGLAHTVMENPTEENVKRLVANL